MVRDELRLLFDFGRESHQVDEYFRCYLMLRGEYGCDCGGYIKGQLQGVDELLIKYFVGRYMGKYVGFDKFIVGWDGIVGRLFVGGDKIDLSPGDPSDCSRSLDLICCSRDNDLICGWRGDGLSVEECVVFLIVIACLGYSVRRDGSSGSYGEFIKIGRASCRERV